MHIYEIFCWDSRWRVRRDFGSMSLQHQSWAVLMPTSFSRNQKSSCYQIVAWSIPQNVKRSCTTDGPHVGVSQPASWMQGCNNSFKLVEKRCLQLATAGTSCLVHQLLCNSPPAKTNQRSVKQSLPRHSMLGIHFSSSTIGKRWKLYPKSAFHTSMVDPANSVRSSSK